MSPRRRRLLRLALALGLVAILPLALFVANGLRTDWRMPATGTTPAAARTGPPRELRVVAFNLAKCDFHRGGLSFASPDEVRARLDRVAALLVAANADLVFLSEVVAEAGPCPVDQVTYLADRAGYHAWAFGENYSWGLPCYRIRAGNAVLSRFPLRPVETLQLTGGKPFWRPTNNRRLPWCEVDWGAEQLLVGSVRNDSFDLEVNAQQAQEILTWLAGRPALLAGDFNAEPDTASMRAFRESGLFTDTAGGPPTWPTSAPGRRIDYVLAPRSWTVLEHRVVTCRESDHLPVFARFGVASGR